MKTFLLEVRSPDKTVFSGEISILVVNAADGKLGVLADHAPLIAVLKGEELSYSTSDGLMNRIPANPGLLVVGNNKASVLLGE